MINVPLTRCLSPRLVTRGGGGGDTNQYITIHEYNNNALNYLCTLRQYALGPVLRCLTSLLSHIGNYHFYLKHYKLQVLHYTRH